MNKSTHLDLPLRAKAVGVDGVKKSWPGVREAGRGEEDGKRLSGRLTVASDVWQLVI